MTAVLSILGIWLGSAGFVYWESRRGFDALVGSLVGAVVCLWWVAPIMWNVV